MRADKEDPRRVEAARRLLAEAPGEAIDRLAALSARLLGAAYAQVSIFTDEHVSLTPETARRPDVRPEIEATFNGTAIAHDSYLGAPIEVAGARVGVLCVHDDEPFEWTGHDQDLLQELASTVGAELERGALALDARSSAVRLDLGAAAANIGTFDWDVRTNELHWDERLIELFGYDVATFVPHYDSFSARMHADDKARVEGALAQAIDRCGDYRSDYRIVLPGGEVRWVAARGRVLCDEDGRPAKMLGAAFDATAARNSGERLGRVLETMSTAFLTLDLERRFTYVNGAAERILGRTRAQLVGRPSPPELEAAIASGDFHPAPDEWFEVRATPSDDGLAVSFFDVSGRVHAEREASAATGRLQILTAAGARLAGTLEVDELLSIIGDVVVNGFGDGAVIVLDGEIVHAVPSGRDAGVVGHLSGRVPTPAAGESTWGGRPALTLPLISRGRTLGAIVVLDPVRSKLDRRVLVEIAARAGVALDNAVLYGAERRLALTLQHSLLPADLPTLPGIELAARYLPGTGGRDVGGDFYIAHKLEDGRLLLVIGDVMGHGAQAAARMGQLRAVVAAYAYDGDPPDRVLAHLSIRATALLDLPMATVLVSVYDPERRQLTFSLAGHLPPLIGGEFVEARPGPPLGTETADYERFVVEVPPGESVVYFTDGLIEDRVQPIDVGMQSLRSAVAELPPDALADQLLQALGRVDGAEDDIALLIMRHLPPAPPSANSR